MGNANRKKRTNASAIKRLRKALGWTQLELAARLGIDRSSVAHIESGHRQLSRSAQMLFDQLNAEPSAPASTGPSSPQQQTA